MPLAIALDTDTTPSITSVVNSSAGDTYSIINFTVNHSNALTHIKYSINSDLSNPLQSLNQSNVTNRSINITGLNNGTRYYYSVYAFSGSNTSLWTNSSISNFTTNNNVTYISLSMTSWSNNKTNSTSLSVTVNTSEIINFNASANQSISTWRWCVNGTDQNNNFNNFTSSWNAVGNRTMVVKAQNSNGISNSVTWDVMVQDITHQASITNLTNITYASTYINWTWIDPSDPDFSKVMVYLDGVYQNDVLKGVQYYNATVVPGTYTIGIRTVDTNGNINATLVTHIASTIFPSIRFINGIIKDSLNKTGISGVWVSTNTSLSTMTNATGFYSFAVTSGTYNLRAKFEPTYYGNNTITFSTIGNAVVIQDIELLKKPTGTIIGKISNYTNYN